MNKTLEEAAKSRAGTEYLDSCSENAEHFQDGFKAGANYQKSITPFSEEDMIGFAEYAATYYPENMHPEDIVFENRPLAKELLKLYLKNKNK